MTQPDSVQTGHPQRKIGLLPNDPDKPRLRLGQVLTTGYTGTVPATVDYSSKVSTWPMALNDQLGDCTAAEACHHEQVWSTWGQSKPFTATDADVQSFYSGSTGYVPGRPSTDQGGVLQDVLNYWRKTGLAGHKIAAFFEANPDDADQLRAALYLFGGLSIGMDFPSFAMDQFDAGKPWDVQTRNAASEGGHCVYLVGMTKGGNYRVVTWGRVQEVTPAFWAKYMGKRAGGEAWCPLSLEWVASSGKAPEGLDTAALNAAFQAITGQPGPFTGSTPAPTPATPSMADKTFSVAAKAWQASKGADPALSGAVDTWRSARGL